MSTPPRIWSLEDKLCGHINHSIPFFLTNTGLYEIHVGVCVQSHQCTHCHKQFAHRGNLMRHLALHDPNNAEYQEALRRDDASTGDEAEYETTGDEGTTFLELHNAVAGADGGVQLTELDGDQMQVCCRHLTSSEYSLSRCLLVLERL